MSSAHGWWHGQHSQWVGPVASVSSEVPLSAAVLRATNWAVIRVSLRWARPVGGGIVSILSGWGRGRVQCASDAHIRVIAILEVTVTSIVVLYIPEKMSR